MYSSTVTVQYCIEHDVMFTEILIAKPASIGYDVPSMRTRVVVVLEAFFVGVLCVAQEKSEHNDNPCSMNPCWTRQNLKLDFFRFAS